MHVDTLTQETLNQNLQSGDYSRIVTMLRRLLPAKDSKSDDERLTAILHDTFWYVLKNEVKDYKQRKAYREKYPEYYSPIVAIDYDRKPLPFRVKETWTREECELAAENAYLLNKDTEYVAFPDLPPDAKAAIMRTEMPDMTTETIAKFLDLETQDVLEMLSQYGLNETTDDQGG